VGGVVQSVFAFFNTQVSNGQPLAVDIRSLRSDGQPGVTLGSAIYSQKIPFLPPPLLTTFDFSASAVQLVAGEHYFAVFSVPGRPFNERQLEEDYIIWKVENNPRSGGFPPLLSDGGSPFGIISSFLHAGIRLASYRGTGAGDSESVARRRCAAC